MITLVGYEKISQEEFSVILSERINRRKKLEIALKIDMAPQSIENAINGKNSKNEVIAKVAKHAGIVLAILETSEGKTLFIKK